MSALDDFKKSKALCVCVDSDGCAMDTMNIKHIRCFGPCMVDEWGLDAWREAILERWNVINLYSGTRGINRFKGLAMALGEISAQYTPIAGVEALIDWAEHAPELSNDAIKKELGRDPIFQKALDWSIAVNKAITELPQAEVKPFDHVREALAQAHRVADVVVVSSANPEAVREEWKRFGLIEDVDLLCTQEMGSKAYCISKLCEKGYGPANILMCGDAPGDDQAAAKNGVLYYPILVSHENESWQLFLDEALNRFVNGGYAGEYQAARRAAFNHNLGL